MLSVLWSCPVCKRVIHKENLYLHLPVAQFYTEETGEELKSENTAKKSTRTKGQTESRQITPSSRLAPATSENST
ncbi:hypothetical protein V3C99_008117 [Haemonchus contortus]|uniref:RING-type domain-containing protein n=1 Tax=Haemonchus contortus TaxID=6289 RepID=A0A7I5EB33_HAECO